MSWGLFHVGSEQLSILFILESRKRACRGSDRGHGLMPVPDHCTKPLRVSARGGWARLVRTVTRLGSRSWSSESAGRTYVLDWPGLASTANLQAAWSGGPGRRQSHARDSYSNCGGGDVASTRALSEQERKTYARCELFLF